MSRAQSLDAETLKGLFAESGALLEGHFLLSSGLHSGRYLQCALLLADPRKAQRVGEALAGLQNDKPDLVLSPALGGLIIGHEVARALGVRAYFAERENGAMALRRGFSIRPGEKVVVVEDVITTGKSSREVVELTRSRGAELVGVLALVDRTAGAAGAELPMRSLMRMTIPSFKPENCALCRSDKPLVKPGSRSGPAQRSC